MIFILKHISILLFLLFASGNTEISNELVSFENHVDKLEKDDSTNIQLIKDADIVPSIFSVKIPSSIYASFQHYKKNHANRIFVQTIIANQLKKEQTSYESYSSFKLMHGYYLYTLRRLLI